MRLILIAALTHTRVIGKDRSVPWDIPEDMKRFKRLTLGHVVLMGRGTYDTLSTLLTERRNVVLTSHPIDGMETYPSIGKALQSLENEGDVYVIGGGQVFAQLLLSAAELKLTLVDKDIDGDTFFPPYEHLVGSVFQVTAQEDHSGFSFIDYARIAGTT